MNCLKKRYIHFLFFYFFLTVPCTVILAEPGQEDLPPLPPDQEKPFPEPPKLPPKDPDSIIYYRGNRMYTKDSELKVIRTRGERLDENTILLEIFFNQSINPRTVDNDSILLDDEPLPDDTRFMFNRKGDIIRIILDFDDDDFLLTVQNIRSFNGIVLEPEDFDIQVFLPPPLEEFLKQNPSQEGEEVNKDALEHPSDSEEL